MNVIYVPHTYENNRTGSGRKIHIRPAANANRLYIVPECVCVYPPPCTRAPGSSRRVGPKTIIIIFFSTPGVVRRRDRPTVLLQTIRRLEWVVDTTYILYPLFFSLFFSSFLPDTARTPDLMYIIYTGYEVRKTEYFRPISYCINIVMYHDLRTYIEHRFRGVYRRPLMLQYIPTIFILYDILQLKM